MSSVSDTSIGPFRLRPSFSPRIWGKRDLAPWFAHADVANPIGEAWLTGPEGLIETGPLAGSTLAQAVSAHPLQLLGSPAASDFPLLVKILFPQQKLSVQVHPDDSHAQQVGQPRGKTECWYVLEATLEAAIALGLRPGVTVEALRAAVSNNASGPSIDALLNWLPVAPGDMIFVEAGTVHAIGPGVTLLEIQQTSDLTYRIYDYGRPRELQLDEAFRVLKPRTSAGKITPTAGNGFTRLIERSYFTADRFDLAAGQQIPLDHPADIPQCLIALRGCVTVSCAGCEPVRPSTRPNRCHPRGLLRRHLAFR